MPSSCKAIRTRGDEPREVEPRGVEQVARGSIEGVSIVGGSVSLFGTLFGMRFWTRFWLEIGLKSTLEHRSPGSLWIRAGEKDRFERRNRLPDTHWGARKSFVVF